MSYGLNTTYTKQSHYIPKDPQLNAALDLSGFQKSEQTKSAADKKNEWVNNRPKPAYVSVAYNQPLLNINLGAADRTGNIVGQNGTYQANQNRITVYADCNFRNRPEVQEVLNSLTEAQRQEIDKNFSWISKYLMPDVRVQWKIPFQTLRNITRLVTGKDIATSGSMKLFNNGVNAATDDAFYINFRFSFSNQFFRKAYKKAVGQDIPPHLAGMFGFTTTSITNEIPIVHYKNALKGVDHIKTGALLKNLGEYTKRRTDWTSGQQKLNVSTGNGMSTIGIGAVWKGFNIFKKPTSYSGAVFVYAPPGFSDRHNYLSTPGNALILKTLGNKYRWLQSVLTPAAPFVALRAKLSAKDVDQIAQKPEEMISKVMGSFE